MLALLPLVNPGDEVIVFDPYFVMYESLVGAGRRQVRVVDTYPDFRIDVDRVRAAITPRTKVIMFNSPANPTGVVATADDSRAWPTGGRAERAAGQRRDLQPFLLR